MEWNDWNRESLERARDRGCPIVLLITASWCRWSRELEDRVLGTPAVASFLDENFVKIHVDKDRRPDVDSRYSQGGWPAICYLDEEGELIAGETFLEPEELLAKLRIVAEAYATSRDSIRSSLRRPDDAGDPELGAGRGRAPRTESTPDYGEIVADIAESLVASSDPIHGGWGKEHRFPHPEAIDFALVRWSETGDDRLRHLVTRTLRSMQEGEIHDQVDGGFYRYATSADWSSPHYEKVLDSNAARLVCYLEGYQALGIDSFRRTAEGILTWMVETLHDPDTGAFRGSQDADASYAHLRSREARAERGAPPCDPTIFTNWNAQATSALFKASVVLGDPSYGELARGTLDFLLRELFDASVGMYHYFDGTYHLPGLLSDQAYMLRALVDAAQFTGEHDHLHPALELAGSILDQLRRPDGAFDDIRHISGAPGGLGRRNRSLLENAVVAESLIRLGALVRDEELQRAGSQALATFAGEYHRYGPFMAGYGRAVDLLVHPPVHVTILGSRDDGCTRALLEAARGLYVASRIVQVVDPQLDADFLNQLRLPAPVDGTPRTARAYVQRGRESYAETSDPGRLPGLMLRIERAG